MVKCISCGRSNQEVVRFPCPKCGSETVRCAKCRNLSIKYTCPNCGHVGP